MRLLSGTLLNMSSQNLSLGTTVDLTVWLCQQSKNTNEHFTVEEFIRANCEYPGEWDGEVEKVITTDMHIITATHVFSKDGSISCHATSFIRVVDGKIASVDEYWGDDGAAPQWRQDKHIGITIKE